MHPQVPGQWRAAGDPARGCHGSRSVPPLPQRRIPMTIQRMSDLDLAGKRVLIRQDLNVPVEGGKVTSDLRILASLPTLRAVLDAGAAVMVMSHLDRKSTRLNSSH